MRHAPQLFIAACLATAEPAAAEPETEVTLGSSRGLTVFKIAVPASRFAGPDSPFTPIGDWRAEVVTGSAREVYLGFDARQPSLIGVYGLVEAARPLTLRVHPVAGSSLTRSAFTLELDPGTVVPADGAALLAQWSFARRWALLPYPPGESAGGLLRPMLLRSAKLYEANTAASDIYPERRRRGRAARAARSSSAFSLFSGEAAVEETLQKQLLETPAGDDGHLHELGELAGPEVPSHPFSEMVEGRDIQTPAIASLVPPDRYLVHLDDIGAALAWLDQTATSGLELIGSKLGSHIEHGLVDRYLSRLHLSRSLVERLASSGVIREAALFGPDLYLTHGSELTVILDASDSLALSVVLAPLLGRVLGADPGGVTSYGAGRQAAYFARHGQWLIFSTSEREAEAALGLAVSGGAGSLGQSAEFRHMYGLLPAKAGASGPFVYLSDPFIRSMVGPETKIAQLRRHRARARLNLVAAGQALHQLERGGSAPLETLIERGYVEQPWLSAPEGDRITLTDPQSDNGRAESSLYGTLDDMVPLSRLTIDTVTSAERQGYEQYVTEYTSYWSQFFDPIGIRLSMTDPMRIETVILPLIESSIYVRLRDLIGGEPVDLRVPRYAPEPVTMLSLKMPPASVIEPLAGLNRLAPGHEIFGDAVHVALYDSAPLVALGSADLAGAFSGAWLGGGQNWLLWGGLIGSMLTQPTAIFLELAPSFARAGNVEAALHASLFTWLRSEVGRTRLDRVADDEWVFTWQFEGLVRFHAYVSLVDDYLVIANHRMSLTAAAGGVESTTANAALRVRFDQIDELEALLGLHRLQLAQASAHASAERLRPFFLLGAVDVEEAMDRHERLHGTRPLPPMGSRWRWNARTGRLENDRFGDPFEAHLPSEWTGAQGDVGTGPFEGLHRLAVDFRFEEDGVRAVVQVE